MEISLSCLRTSAVLIPRAGAASQFPFPIKAMPAGFPDHCGTRFAVVYALKMPVTEIKHSDYSNDVKDHVPIDDEQLGCLLVW